MSDLEMSKLNIVKQLRGLCAHCSVGRSHQCPLQDIFERIQKISGVPLLVNNEFKGVIWNN
jgi:hypothetical protein